MRKTNPKRTLHFYLILCGLTLLTVTSCVFTNNKEEDSLMTYINGNDYKYENVEAELLAEFSEKNLNLISISNKVKEKEVPFRVKCLAKNLAQEQIKINKIINQITSEKLIIIPSINIQNDSNELDKVDSENFKKKYLEIVTKIIKSQIHDLTMLSETTKDVDFKILALQTIVKLSNSLDEVKQIKTTQT
ncbi:hypothetical protein FIA58_014560 [Flavobacterium jejuense]|uniref:DUF4142 domain-containing protein n=1 Tax=Flavobacterium jejuense TaxID=1544455 RepID=A0ABX0IYS9_9FLAO|nr:hypothetical protein [Flavobacterium jejuense]NHN26904.1 hypothetical protein [Flavobacterium jejuense]